MAAAQNGDFFRIRQLVKDLDHGDQIGALLEVHPLAADRFNPDPLGQTPLCQALA